MLTEPRWSCLTTTISWWPKDRQQQFVHPLETQKTLCYLMHVFFPPQSHQHFPKQKARPHSPLFSTPGEEVFQCTSAITEMDKTSATGCSYHAHMMQNTCGCRDSICCLLGELSFSNRNEKAMARKLPRATYPCKCNDSSRLKNKGQENERQS